MTQMKSGFLHLNQLSDIAVGLNIEGCRPVAHLPVNCKWYNIVQVIDEPLKGILFDDIMQTVKENSYQYIEQAVGINIDTLINQLVTFVTAVAKHHKNVLIHVHQYENTTLLAETLQKKTQIKAITDKTNYYENPVIYSSEYPDIDALISISQCAGFSVPVGQWIIPTNYMSFDVSQKIVYTTPQVVTNHATEHFPYDYIGGTVLVVNDLWNPKMIENDGIDNYSLATAKEGLLLFDELDTRVFEFVKESTQIFDDSHNWKHALQVARNSTLIRNTQRTLHLALLHDVCDHKYPNAIPRSELTQFINTHLTQHSEIDGLISKVSYTYRKTHRDDKDVLTDPDLQAVVDGDQIDALGIIGITRCEETTRLNGKKVPEDVIVHCYDKLLKLLPEKFITTNIGRKISLAQHNIIVKYVQDNLPYTSLTYQTPEFLEN